ncbi:MAG: SH3 domain-containing protein [Clostridiales bacterium]|nr:SH3 domain-containing protein [Clostridiales bacterium]
MMISSLTALGTESFPFIGYAAESLTLRHQPSADGAFLLTIPQGDALAVNGADGSYYIVEYAGYQGYVPISQISRSPLAADAIAATPKPADSALTAKYPPLSKGSSGEMVTILQRALKELNYYKGSIDGKFGTGTAQAVEAMQAKNKLPKNGIADAVTQQRLYEGKPLNTAGRAIQVKNKPVVTGQTLRPGDRGAAVSVMQQQLKDLGYLAGSVDGVYGTGTEKAVRAFQTAHKLKADGKVGPLTQTSIDNALAQKAAPVASPTAVPQAGPTHSPVFTDTAADTPATYPYQTTTNAGVNLRKRASTNSARILTVPRGATITVQSTSGDFLKIAYKTYTGFVMSDYVEIPEQYLEGKVLPIDSTARQNYEALGVGASGYKVRALQQALTELGFLKGSIDGTFGTTTLTALKAFQEANGLRPTGIALPELQKLLYEGKPVNAGGRKVALKVLPPIPGYPMQSGDTGDAVAELQNALKQLGHYDGEISGIYSAKTVNAVKAFQKAHSIKQSGKIDSFTMLAINTAMGKGLSDNNDPQQPNYTPLTEDNVIIMRSGTRGVAVTRLQMRLVSLGYYQITPDGVYNAKDIAAVKEFQKKNGLLVTGTADLPTQLAMYASTALSATAQQPTNDYVPLMTIASQPSLQQLLRIGSTGEAVLSMQSRLIALQYLTGKADGIFGTQTAAAVSAFQRKNNLAADGIAGSNTLTALYANTAVANRAVGSTASAEEDNAATIATLRVGDSGPAVKSMQQHLIDLKYLAGAADGVFGPKTFLALKDFQMKNNLSADGIAGKLTLARLNDPAAISATGLTALLPTPTPAPLPSAPVQTGNVTAPRASEVRYADWYKEIRSRIKDLPNVIIYDFMSSTQYNVKVFSVGRHADGEPVTKQDTQTMERVLGYNNWDPRPVWVIFSDGRVYMASTHSHGHEVDHNPNNGLTGHICIHFPRDMADAESTGPYAVAHQQAILAGWDLTQSMAK